VSPLAYLKKRTISNFTNFCSVTCGRGSVLLTAMQHVNVLPVSRMTSRFHITELTGQNQICFGFESTNGSVLRPYNLLVAPNIRRHLNACRHLSNGVVIHSLKRKLVRFLYSARRTPAYAWNVCRIRASSDEDSDNSCFLLYGHFRASVQIDNVQDEMVSVLLRSDAAVRSL